MMDDVVTAVPEPPHGIPSAYGIERLTTSFHAMSASRVRAPTRRRMPFTFEKASSI